VKLRALALVALLPLAPPPPDVAPLVPFVTAPIEKPPIVVTPPALPEPLAALPHVPPAARGIPFMATPTAALPAAGTAPCLWSWLPSVTERLKCGLSRFQRGEFGKARETLEDVVRSRAEPQVAAEARYWLGETLLKLAVFDQADALLRPVAQDASHPVATWALHASGWTGLRLDDPARAREAFARVVAANPAAPLDVWARHGLGLALYALGRYEDADRTWTELAARTVPATLRRDVMFWSGETLGRVGQYAKAETALKAFVQLGPGPFADTALVRQGWWGLQAGHGAANVATFRAALAPGRSTPSGERDWADAGLALALLAGNDPAGARTAARALEARRSPLATPVLLRLVGAAIKGPVSQAHALIQEVLAGTLSNEVRAWVLLANGDVLRASGKSGEARTQYDLARQIDPATPVGWHAALRLLAVDLETRDFDQALATSSSLLGSALPADLRIAALLLTGETAYHAGQHSVARDVFVRAAGELTGRAELAGVRLALAWTTLRLNRDADARRLFTEFARDETQHPHAVDALLVASELALTARDVAGARPLLDQILTTYVTHPRADFARLNRAILLARAGDTVSAERQLRDWIAKAPFPPLVGHAHAALGATLLAKGDATAAASAFTVARREGLTGLGALGLGAAALSAGRLDEAIARFAEARDAGPAPITAASHYGVAAATFAKGARPEFKGRAAVALQAAPPGSMTPRLLYALAGIAAEDADWRTAMETAREIVDRFPAEDAGEHALERVGAGAAKAGAWDVAYDAYALLRRQYPHSAFIASSRVAFAEARLHTGRADEARRELEQIVGRTRDAAPGERTWRALGQAREAAGDRRGALEAYARAVGDKEAMLGQGRVLTGEQRWQEARAALGPLLAGADASLAAEAARWLGEMFRGEGDHLAAAEYFMTAVYLSRRRSIASSTSARRREIAGA
jgi:tetratricopeptide (TPR) repeat protein